MRSEPETTFQITLSPECARRLTELASEMGIQPEAFLLASIEEWLARPQTNFAEAAAFVLKKNTDLYRKFI